MKNLDFTTTDLKNKLYITVHHIKTDKLDDPRTVCNDCYELDRKGNKMYFVCHDHCYLEGVKEDVTLRPELQECAAISDDDTCRVNLIGANECLFHFHTTVTMGSLSFIIVENDQSNKNGIIINGIIVSRR